MQPPIPDPVEPPAPPEDLSYEGDIARPLLLSVLFAMTWIELFCGYFFLHLQGNIHLLLLETPLQTAVNLAPAILLLPVAQYFLWSGKNWMRRTCLAAETLGIFLALVNYFGTTGNLKTPEFDGLIVLTGCAGIFILTQPAIVTFFKGHTQESNPPLI